MSSEERIMGLTSHGKTLDKLIIPSQIDGMEITSIGDRAFEYCDSFTSVIISDSVISIGQSAFANCDGLTSIEIPDRVTSIGKSAFYGCSGLTSVTIPDSVTSIGSYAFYGCRRLREIVIPKSVTSMGSWVFYDCTLKTIYCEAERKPINWSTSWHVERSVVTSFGGYKPTESENYYYTVVWGYQKEN